MIAYYQKQWIRSYRNGLKLLDQFLENFTDSPLDNTNSTDWHKKKDKKVHFDNYSGIDETEEK